MEIRLKLEKVISKHELLKSSFLELTSDVRAGLLQAQEVYTSLAIPLTKLVGLKTAEMAQEGRFSNIVIDPNLLHQGRPSNSRSGLGSPAISQSTVQDDDVSCHNHNLVAENYAAKAAMAGREVLDNQYKQLVYLVQLLGTMGNEVNSSHNNMVQSINDRRLSLCSFFRKAVTYVSNLNASNHDIFPATLKIFQATCHAVSLVLNSVESGLEDLMQSLVQQMRDPLVQYVKALKSDIKDGPCAQLVAMVDDMGKAITSGRTELEKAREDLKSAQEAKNEACRRLSESEERMRNIKECFDFLLHGNKRSREFKSVVSFSNEKFWYMVENEAMNGQQMWSQLKKRSFQAHKSPHGPEELFFMPNKRRRTGNGIRVRNSMAHTSLVRNHINSPKTPRLDYAIPLGSSP